MDTDRLRTAVDWRDGCLEVVDQTALPERLSVLRLASVAEVVDALRRLVVRGAPAIGVCAAFGVVVGLDERGGRDVAEARANTSQRMFVGALEGSNPCVLMRIPRFKMEFGLQTL